MLRELSICPLMALFDLTEWITIITVELPAHCLFTFVISCKLDVDNEVWMSPEIMPSTVCSSHTSATENTYRFLRYLADCVFPKQQGELAQWGSIVLRSDLVFWNFFLILIMTIIYWMRFISYVLKREIEPIKWSGIGLLRAVSFATNGVANGVLSSL